MAGALAASVYCGQGEFPVRSDCWYSRRWFGLRRARRSHLLRGQGRGVVYSQDATVPVRGQELDVEIDLGLIDKRRQKCLTETPVMELDTICEGAQRTCREGACAAEELAETLSCRARDSRYVGGGWQNSASRPVRCWLRRPRGLPHRLVTARRLRDSATDEDEIPREPDTYERLLWPMTPDQCAGRSHSGTLH